ncbi:hypothetical protein FACS189490_09200 [Clostridia bacterium]|nr:hypothetical protein FACS189490_09200 [Clostridia bacterium]
MKKFALWESILAITLTGVLAYGSYTVIVSAGAARDRLSEFISEQTAEQTALSYFNAKIKQSDLSGALSVKNAPGGDAVVIYKKAQDGAETEQWIYFFDGFLREYTASKGETPDFGKGEKIAELTGWKAEYNGNGYFVNTITYARKGGERTAAQNVGVYCRVTLYDE